MRSQTSFESQRDQFFGTFAKVGSSCLISCYDPFASLEATFVGPDLLSWVVPAWQHSWLQLKQLVLIRYKSHLRSTISQTKASQTNVIRKKVLEKLPEEKSFGKKCSRNVCIHCGNGFKQHTKRRFANQAAASSMLARQPSKASALSQQMGTCSSMT